MRNDFSKTALERIWNQYNQVREARHNAMMAISEEAQDDAWMKEKKLHTAFLKSLEDGYEEHNAYLLNQTVAIIAVNDFGKWVKVLEACGVNVA